MSHELNHALQILIRKNEEDNSEMVASNRRQREWTLLGKRTRAFAHGKPLRVRVTAEDTAPKRFETDRLLFDRVVDNLLTNAIKYTDQSLITVSLGDKPGVFTVTVQDTGQGIATTELTHIFLPGGSDRAPRRKWSHGVGLSVVVRLLDHIGGRLEVASLPGVGTRFSAHFPSPSTRRRPTPCRPRRALPARCPRRSFVAS